MNEKKKSRKSIYIKLHIILLLYSISAVCSKKAAGVPLFSTNFFILYGSCILFLGLYAIGWQQILKKLPLTTAFANKAITVVWGIVWGSLLFHETINIRHIIGAALVVLGVVLYAYADSDGRR